MILKGLKYSLHFNGDESEEFVRCPIDVYYTDKNKTYRQFYKNQLIPIEVYNELFPKEKVEEVKSEETEDITQIDSKKVEENIKQSSPIKKVTVKKTKSKK